MFLNSRKTIFKRFLVQQKNYAKKGKAQTPETTETETKKPTKLSGKVDVTKLDRKFIGKILYAEEEDNVMMLDRLVRKAEKSDLVDPKDEIIRQDPRVSKEEMVEQEDRLSAEDSYVQGIANFKTQYGWEEEFDQVLLGNKARTHMYGNVKMKHNKKPIQNYEAPEDIEFQKYKEQKGSNYEELPDNYGNYLPQGTQIIIEEDGESKLLDLSNLNENETLPEIPNINRTDFYLKALKIEPGKYQDEPNESFKYLYTRDPISIKEISVQDFSKIFIITQPEYDKYFGIAKLATEIEHNFEKVQQRAIMIRSSTEPVLRHLRLFRHGKHVKRAGMSGCGKSANLTTLTYHCYLQKFLVFHIPNGYFWMRGNQYIVPSPLLEGYYDCPMPTASFLKQFTSGNEEILKTMKLSKDYKLPVLNFERTKKQLKNPTTLYELCQYGLSHDKYLLVVFKLLLDELYANKTVKMVFAIDDYNFFNHYTPYSYGDIDDVEATELPPKLHAKQFTLVRALDRMLLANHQNKTFICAESKKHKIIEHSTLMDSNALTAINVQRYTYNELNRMCAYYMAANYVFGTPDIFLEDLMFLTGGIPSKIFKEMMII